jgi:hypothetical protein
MIKELNTEGFLITEIAGAWSLLTADFGDGYGAGALIGDPSGTRTFTIRLDVLPGEILLGAGIDEKDFDPALALATEDLEFLTQENGGLILLELRSSRAQYLWHFFRTSKAAGDQPFWMEIEDPEITRRQKFLVSFSDHNLSYQVLCARIYGSGLTMRQRRLAGVTSPILVEEE